MMKIATRTASLAAAAMLAAVPIADAAKKKPPVKVPKSGHFHGKSGGRSIDLYTQGKLIQIAAFDFKCGAVKGRTSINDIKMKWSRKGYRFGLKTHGNITYSDEQQDENGAISFWGRFTPAGNRVTGTYRVRSSRCGSTGTIEWRAKR
jgi:hypothetical protein